VKTIATDGLQNLACATHRLRSVLDRIAPRYWDLYIVPRLSEADKKAASTYFPIAPNQYRIAIKRRD
jgi:hypothetical protein